MSCNMRHMYEFAFEHGDKITEILKAESIPSLRAECAEGSLAVARGIAAGLFEADTIATAVCFRNGSAKLKVWSEIDRAYKEYDHYTVVFLGECVMDVRHSDELVPTYEYIESLERANENLCIDTEMCWAQFPDDKGQMQPVTLKFMKEYVSPKHKQGAAGGA